METTEPKVRETLDLIASATLDESVPEDDGAPAVAADEPATGLQDATRQGAVVDSNLATWPDGTPLAVKNLVSAWMVFAQRAASAAVPNKEDTVAWFDAYLNTLESTGWANRSEAAAWHEENAFGSQVHQKILQFAAVALGPVPGALALVTAALTSLQQMNEHSKWITLFDHRGRGATAVGFQIASCEAGQDGSAELDAADFRIHAESTMTQVLFFRFNRKEASMFYRRTRLELSQHSMETYGPAIQERVDALVKKVVASFPLEGVEDAPAAQ